MRAVLLLPLALALGGCIKLGAKPMTFTCGDLLTKNVQTYQPTPLFAELQRDAGGDDLPPDAAIEAMDALPQDRIDDSTDPLILALGRQREGLVAEEVRPPAMLMLSGGGSWGAFGAGFLNRHGRKDWTAVAGISTGAMQGLLVAAGDYERLVREYDIERQEDLALTNGLLGIVRKGSQYDLRPLHAKVMAYLLDASGGETALARMARAGSPELFVGMVEARSGDLKVVALTNMVRSVLNAPGGPAPGQVDKLAACVAGVTLASSSIPVRLTPVQIDGRTYMDGGVRASVFDTGMARRHAAFQATRSDRAPPSEIYVIRNGPTVVFRDALDAKLGIPQVDARPDLFRVGMRGYSTIVNQSELMSIASLRLNHPKGPIFVMTADGFNTRGMNPEPCGPRPEAVFHAGFMKCLIRWGDTKAQTKEWIRLPEAEFREIEPEQRRRR
ncbi:patatin-like phospholipase family protein [Sphingomonas sp.]|uniref:patatin-like phospholipase family protein n=1 Tax=Sphingomonas sp. TaxID=28214 RepID=UPI0031D406FE